MPGLHPGGPRRRRRPDDRRALRPADADPLGRAATAARRRARPAHRPGRQRVHRHRRPGPRRRPARPAADPSERPTASRTSDRSDLLFPAEPAPARASPASCTRSPADLPLISPARARRPGAAGRRRAVPRPGPAAHRARPLPDPDAAQPGHPARPARACPRRDGAPVRDRRPGDLAAASPRTGTCSAAPRRGCGWSRPSPRSSASHTPLGPDTADEVYDALAARLAEPEFRPRALFERFNIEVLATTESPLDDLAAHAKLAADGWGGPGGRVITTFRPDDVVDMEWRRLGRPASTGSASSPARTPARTPATWPRCGRAGQAFIAAGATSSDHGHPTARTLRARRRRGGARSSTGACAGEADAADAEAFRAHMLVEFARMSHRGRPGHAAAPRRGAQPQPVAARQRTAATSAATSRRPPTTCTRCAPLLDAYGNDPRLRLVLYTLDETRFTRELAPLAGGYAGALPRRAVVVPGLARRCCAGSARRSPRPPASTTPPASSTTPARSAPSRSATTWPAGSTPASWPGSSPRTGCRWTRPPRPSSTSPTTCPSGSSDSED